MSQTARSFDTAFGNEVSKLIQSRRTTKLLANSDSEIAFAADACAEMDAAVMESIVDAGYAPFHYDRGVDDIAEPWRFYVLKQEQCPTVGRQMAGMFPEMRPNNKLPAMLSACGCLVLVTWLPQFDGGSSDEKQVQVDEEHLAAAAAATQNLLLSLTAKNFPTYWSSGGFFRKQKMFEFLNIDTSERLLSAVFVDYGADRDQTEALPGKQHEHRSPVDAWTKTVSL